MSKYAFDKLEEEAARLQIASADDATLAPLKPIVFRIVGEGAPPFTDESLSWLFGIDTASRYTQGEIVVAIAASFTIDGCPDALLLTSRRRQLLFCLPDRSSEPAELARAFKELQLLLCHEGRLCGQRVRVVGYRSALLALHIAAATGCHVRMEELSSILSFADAPNVEAQVERIVGKQTYRSLMDLKATDWLLDNRKDMAKIMQQYEMAEAEAQVDAEGAEPSHVELDLSDREVARLVDSGASFVGQVISTAVSSLASYVYAVSPQLKESRMREIIVDTRRLCEKDFRVAADIMTAFQAVITMHPKTRQLQFATVHTKDGKTAEIRNNRYREQPRVNTRQTVNMTLKDGEMLVGQVSRAVGKTSLVKFKGRKLASEDSITEIKVEGRDDPNTAVSKAWNFWRRVLRVSPKLNSMVDQQREALSLLDPSALFYPLYHNEEPVNKPDSWAEIISYYNDVPEDERLNQIESSELNKWQKEAARTLAKPVETHSDRLVLIHGPPGTGKTRVIAQFAKQWLDWSKHWEDKETKTSALGSLYCCCQSNAATKNIADALKRADVKFKILVSDGYHFEWHEHQYLSLRNELVVTKGLGKTLERHPNFFGDVRIFLSTLDGLSSPILGGRQSDLFSIRPMRYLILDEASQLFLGAYPHLLDRHAETLGRMAFFGDDKQLAPFGADTNPGIRSVFELEHLRKDAHLLSISYRLPESLCAFISREVYDGALQSGENVLDGELTDILRIVDVKSTGERRQGTSFVNVGEMTLICGFIPYIPESLDFKILTTYNAQRDLIEENLKNWGLPWEDRVFTVDSFQGQEADLIIVSLVRGGDHGHSAGFLVNARRVNVMLTRTKKFIYVFSSRSFLNDYGAPGQHTLMGKLADEMGEAGWISEEQLGRGKRLLNLDR